MKSLSFALYLAASWTWCIGMYLPTLLVRDAGKAGFLAFFIPNVIGAASVGWLLAGRARPFYESKKPIILAFTAVTIAFHGYWIVWMVNSFVGTMPLELFIGMAVAASVVLNAVALTKAVRGVAAAITILFSLGAAVGIAGTPADAAWLSDSTIDVVGLAAVCAVGFGLCPYLDLTFNKAAIESKRPRLIFTVGFLVFGLVLLIVTRGRVLWSTQLQGIEIDPWTLSMLIGAHFGAQTTFTVAAHSEAVRTTGRSRLKSFEGLWLTLFPASIGLVLGLGAVAFKSFELFGMPLTEIGYRGFLAAYGLVFPAWLLLTWGNKNPTHPNLIRALLITCFAALPFFAYGFIALREVWLLPGLAIMGAAIVYFRR